MHNVESVDELDPDFEKDERLFHYTSSEGLYGILESGCIWASHFQFLNDSKEFFSAKTSLAKFLGYEIKRWLAAEKVKNAVNIDSSVTLGGLASSEAERIVDILYRNTLGGEGKEPFSY
ncbi:MAG: hypothetical protein V3S07_08765, partial [Micropepsaceae bacterium]